jgi:hypothetical protein
MVLLEIRKSKPSVLNQIKKMRQTTDAKTTDVMQVGNVATSQNAVNTGTKPKRKLALSIFFGKKKEAAPEKKVVIGKPKNFQRVGHMRYNSLRGFTDISSEWTNIFEKAGITRKSYV